MIWISRQQLVHLVPFQILIIFETKWRASPECQMWSFFSYKTEFKFVLMILALSRILLILNLGLPFTVSQSEYVWMHIESGKFVLMILAFSKSLIVLNLSFLPPFPLTNAYESWRKLLTIFLIPCKNKPCNVICVCTFIPYVHPCLTLQHLLGPALPQRAPPSCSFASRMPGIFNTLRYLNRTLWYVIRTNRMHTFYINVVLNYTVSGMFRTSKCSSSGKRIHTS
jgi:hypothetical protein